MMRDDVTHLAAGVSYFAIFSLFPILLGFMVVGGIVLDSEVARQGFLQYIFGNAELAYRCRRSAIMGHIGV